MSASILTSVKKNLGLESSYTAFDPDILMYINSVFSDLQQIGIGPPEGFSISDASTLWSAYLGTDKGLNSIETYVYLRVRLLFDPPMTSYLITALEKQIEKLEWRLNVKREGESWVNPFPPQTSSNTLV